MRQSRRQILEECKEVMGPSSFLLQAPSQRDSARKDSSDLRFDLRDVQQYATFSKGNEINSINAKCEMSFRLMKDAIGLHTKMSDMTSIPRTYALISVIGLVETCSDAHLLFG